MKKYEIMYILRPTLDEAARKAQNEAINAIFLNNNAKITKVEDWGNRELAYEIKKVKRGYYMILNVETDEAVAIKEFERIININENVLRYLVVKLD